MNDYECQTSTLLMSSTILGKYAEVTNEHFWGNDPPKLLMG